MKAIRWTGRSFFLYTEGQVWIIFVPSALSSAVKLTKEGRVVIFDGILPKMPSRRLLCELCGGLF